MPRKTSYSVAPSDPSREGILSRGTLAAVVGVALLGLVLVFPKDDLLKRLRGETKSEREADLNLTVAYLRNLTRTEAQDAGLRLLLVEKLIDSRELDEAAGVLDAANGIAMSPSEREHWRELDLNLVWARFRNLRDLTGAAQTANLQAQLAAARAQVELRLARQLQETQSARRVFALATQARDIGANALARAALQRLLALPSANLADLIRGGREALAVGEFALSADLYFKAKTRTTDSEARRSAVGLGVKSLLASGAPVLAFRAAQREFDVLPAGDPLLWQMVDMALAASLPSEAAAYVRQLVSPGMSAQTLAKTLSPAQLQTSLDVAMGGADLPFAVRLIEAQAVQQPGNTVLQERRAQMLEWAGRSAEALKAWLALLNQGASDKALDNAFRLSPMLYDDAALLAAWQARTQGKRLADADVAQVIAVYERLGLGDQALLFLEQQSTVDIGQSAKKADFSESNGLLGQKTGSRTAFLPQNAGLMSQKGALLARMGRSIEAIASLSELLSGSKANQLAVKRDDAMRLADLQLRVGNPMGALQALQAFRPPEGAGPLPKPASFDAVYWDLLADLAYEAGQTEVWPDAVRRLAQADVKPLALKGYQAERLLRYVYDTASPAEVRALAQRLYRLVPTDGLVYGWLDGLYLEPSKDGLQQFLATLGAEKLVALSSTPEFLERRAGLFAGVGDKASAIADYQRLLAMAPASGARVAYWWLLIDMADTTALRREVAAGGANKRADPAYWEVLGASFQMLGEPRNALAFYQRQAKRMDKDYLWLVNYADVLEQNGDASLALRVRRHAFALLNTALGQVSDMRKKQAAQALIVRVRLSQTMSSGSEQERLQRLLGAVVQSKTLPADLQKQANDLVVSWAIGSGRIELARRWLWQRHADKVGDTDYGQLALALAEGNVAALDALMERSARKFQQIDRLAALQQLGRTASALDTAVALAQKDPEAPKSEELQLSVEDGARALASRVRVGKVSTSSGGLVQSGTQWQADVALLPSLRLELGLTSLGNALGGTGDAIGHPALPARDRELHLALRTPTPLGEFSAALTQRSAWGTTGGLVLKLVTQIGSTSLQALLQRKQRTSDGALMAGAGMQSGLETRISRNVAKDLALDAQLSSAQLQLQSGARLGTQKAAALNATLTLRREYPDLTLQAGLRRSVSSANAGLSAVQVGSPLEGLFPLGTVVPASSFIAPSATAIQLNLGWGLSAAADAAPLPTSPYSRAIRPYAQVGWERRYSEGQSQSSGLLRLGARGSVAGRDQLMLGLDFRPSANGQTNRQVKLQYEWMGDK